MTELEITKEVAGSFAYFLALVAKWQIAGKQRWGFLLGLATNVIWIGVGIYLGFWSMIIWSTLFMGPNIRGYIGWAEPKVSKGNTEKH